MNPGDPPAPPPPPDGHQDTLPQSPADVARLAAGGPPADAPPRAVPGYEVLGDLGSGGMGFVYKARQFATDRVVALKVIRGDGAADRVMLDRFRAEADAVAAVDHPHVVRMLEYGEHAGFPYLALEYLPGGSLADRLRHGARLPPAEAAALLAKVAAGVQAAHDRGIVHRDLKPANILFDAAGEPKVVDFGVAKSAGQNLTRTGATMGTPRYMAPEQAGGSRGVGRAADVWALGVILYECLTGQEAFGGETFEEVVAKVLAARPPVFPPQDPPVPEVLRLVCRRCMDRRPEARYPSAFAVAAVLDDYLSGRAAEAGDDGPPAAARRGAGRWLGLAVVALGSAAVGGSVVGYWPRGSPDPAPVASADPGPAPRVVLGAGYGPVGAVAFLGPHELVTGSEDRVKIWDLRRGVVARVLDPRLPGCVWSADVSADGRYLVASGDDAPAVVWRLEDGKVHLELTHPGSTKAAAFHPGGLLVATGDRAGVVRVWTVHTQLAAEVRAHVGAVHGLAYNPDGTRLVSVGSDGTVRVWEGGRDGLVKVVEMGEHVGPVYGVAFSPDGGTLATTGWDGAVRVWDAATGKQLRAVKAHEGDAWSVSFGHGGKWVASAGSDAVKVFEVETGREVFAFRAARGFRVARFGPDHVTLAAGGRDGAVRVWNLADLAR